MGFFCLFLNLPQVLADGLRTGVTEWPEPLEAKSAVELVQEFLNGVCFRDSHLAFVYFFLIGNLCLLYLNVNFFLGLGFFFVSYT